jgi:hypothetical protein
MIPSDRHGIVPILETTKLLQSNAFRSKMLFRRARDTTVPWSSSGPTLFVEVSKLMPMRFLFIPILGPDPRIFGLKAGYISQSPFAFESRSKLLQHLMTQASAEHPPPFSSTTPKNRLIYWDTVPCTQNADEIETICHGPRRLSRACSSNRVAGTN